MNEEKLRLVCQRLMISLSTARSALSRAIDVHHLTEQLRNAKSFNDSFRVVVEAPIGTHIRIDAITKALSLCVKAADYKLLHDQIGRGSIQADDLIRHMLQHWDPSKEASGS